MCLSGDVANLPAESWDLVRHAITLYAQAAPVIKRGTSRKFGEIGESWRHPQGWQALVRHSETMLLVVVHSYDNAPERMEIPLPAGEWKLSGSLGGSDEPVIRNGRLTVGTGGDFCGRVFLFSR
jgi:alpha-galactosidase